jgi:hypothetical protein
LLAVGPDAPTLCEGWRPDGTASAARPASGDGGAVVLAGRPGELLMHAFGRRRHARVEVLGTDADVAAFTRVYR